MSIRTPAFLLVASLLVIACSGGGSGGAGGGGGGGGGGDPGTRVGGQGLCLSSGFCWENPLPQGNGLSAVWGSASSDVWAVGGGGTALHFDGTAWSAVALPMSAGLFSVHGTGTADVWAAGSGGAVVHWDGAAWTSRPAPVASSDTLKDVFAGPNGEAWVAAYDGGILRWSGGSWTVGANTAAQSWEGIWGAGGELWAAGGGGWWGHSTNGVDWSIAQDGSYVFYDVWASSPTDVWRSRIGALEHSAGVGTQWTSSTPITDDSIQQLFGVAANDVWALGNGSRAHHWNGSAWTGYATGGVAALDAGGLWGTAQDAWVVGTAGRMTRFRGGAFQEVSSGARDVRIMSLAAAGATDVWAVTQGTACTSYPCEGALWRRDATGWTVARTLPSASIEDRIWASGPGDVWLANLGLWRFDGARWTKDAKLGWASEIHGTGPGDVWVVGSDAANALVVNRLWHWDGSAWTDRSPAGFTVTDVFALAPADVWVAGWIQGSYGPDAYKLAHWDGSAWTERVLGTYAPHVDGIWGAATDDVWFVGPAGKIVHWNGTSLSAVTSPTTKDLSIVRGTAANDVWAAGEAGTVLHWDGASWTDVRSGVAGTLDALAVAPGHVFVAGGSALLHRK